jgi:class 3 adenylate cyclase
VPVWGIAALAGFGLALAAVYLAFVLTTGDRVPAGVEIAALGATYLASGALAWRRNAQYWMGPVLVLVGYLVLLSGLVRLPNVGALYAIGSTYGGIHEAVLAYVLLTYPSGRARGGLLGWAAWGLLGIGFALSTLDILTRDTTQNCFIPPCATAPNPFLIVDLGTLAGDISAPALLLASVTVLGLVAWRFVRAKGAARRVLAPVLLAGGLAAGAVVVRSLLPPDLTVSLAVRSAQVLIPVALGIGFVRSRLARGGVADFLVSIGPNPTLPELQAAVRRALHDPSARLVLASPAGDVDVDSHLADQRTDELDEREITPLVSGGRRIGMIIHDPVLAEEADLISSISAATGIVLENARLAVSIRAQADDVARLPTGVVTLLYTDVERSTQLLDELREVLFGEMIEELRRLLRGEVRRAGGQEIDSTGDEFFAVIPEAPAAIRAALAIQRATMRHQWPRGSQVRVRMGLHTGSPERGAASYVGMDVHIAARIGSAGSGGQIVVSDATRAAFERDMTDEQQFVGLGWYRLKGVPAPTRLYQLQAADLPASFPPLRSVELVGTGTD